MNFSSSVDKSTQTAGRGSLVLSILVSEKFLMKLPMETIEKRNWVEVKIEIVCV